MKKPSYSDLPRRGIASSIHYRSGTRSFALPPSNVKFINPRVIKKHKTQINEISSSLDAAKPIDTMSLRGFLFFSSSPSGKQKSRKKKGGKRRPPTSLQRSTVDKSSLLFFSFFFSSFVGIGSSPQQQQAASTSETLVLVTPLRSVVERCAD